MRKTIFMTIIIMLFLNLGGAVADDWTKWRGPTANGISPEIDWNPESIEGNPRILWEANVGMGHSAVVVKGDRLYATGQRTHIAETDTVTLDVVYCLNTKDGSIVWKYEYISEDGLDPGPGSSPIVEGNALYTLSRLGHLYCHDASSGKVLWKRHLVQESLAPRHEWGFSSSPVIDGDLLLLNINKSGIAFDKHTGKLAWNSEQEECSFGTPVLFTHQGKRMAVIAGREHLYAFNTPTGKVEWTLPLQGSDSDPVFFEDKMFFTGGKTALVDLNGSEPEIMWESRRIPWVFQSCTVINGHAYGFGDLKMNRNAQFFQCVDLETGEIKWKKQFTMWGASIAAGDRLILLTGQGKLLIAKASPDAYTEIAGAQIVPMADNAGVNNRRQCHCWTNPVLSNGRLYARNTFGNLICVDLR